MSNMYQHIKEQTPRIGLAVMGMLGACHFALATGFKLYFFEYAG
jgi:hypothetical protein